MEYLSGTVFSVGNLCNLYYMYLYYKWYCITTLCKYLHSIIQMYYSKNPNSEGGGGVEKTEQIIGKKYN